MSFDYEDLVLEEGRERDYERKDLERKVRKARVRIDVVGGGEDGAVFPDSKLG